jgi:hypothetical protein
MTGCPGETKRPDVRPAERRGQVSNEPIREPKRSLGARRLRPARFGVEMMSPRIRTAFGFLVVTVMLVCAGAVRATWKPEYAAYPAAVREWYQQAELTDAARQRFRFKKCCDHADVVKTKFNINRTSSGDEWYWLDGANWRRVPDDIIHWGESAPDGQPTLFVYNGQETCFFPGKSGI